MSDGPRYAFQPLERRGLLLGLDAGQLLTIAGGAVVAIALHAVLGGAAGLVAGLVVAIAALSAALWTRDGTSVGSWTVTVLAWALRGSSRSRIDDAPTAGHLVPPKPRTTAPTRPAGIHLVRDMGLPGEVALGVARDSRAGTWAGVIPVRGCSFSLLDPSEQAQRLEGWRRVLGSLARPGSPVVRVQWLQRSWTGTAGMDPSRHPPLEPAGPAMTHHHAWLVLVIRPNHSHRTAARALTDLRRELRLVEGQLRDAGLDPLDALDLPQLRGLIAGPGCGAVGTHGAWPLASQDRWSAHRTDGAWHATYWIAEWPRVHVGPDFITPLLLGSEHTTVSVVMAPVASDKAMREVRSARTADLADAELRARAGFLQSARRERESEGVTRREAELADGHHEFRFSGYVTVSAEDPDRLTAACAATEHAAQSARLELRRLYGRQAEAYTWTLPLGRGLR